MSAVIMPTLNTEVVNLFLEQFVRELPAGVHAVLIWDGAGFHTGEDVVVPSNVSLIQLPPYSPELNPAENLWHYLRAHHWSNRLYRDYDALQEEAVRSLCAVREDTETIKTVWNPPYIGRGRMKLPGKRITGLAQGDRSCFSLSRSQCSRRAERIRRPPRSNRKGRGLHLKQYRRGV